MCKKAIEAIVILKSYIVITFKSSKVGFSTLLWEKQRAVRTKNVYLDYDKVLVQPNTSLEEQVQYAKQTF